MEAGEKSGGLEFFLVYTGMFRSLGIHGGLCVPFPRVHGDEPGLQHLQSARVSTFPRANGGDSSERERLGLISWLFPVHTGMILVLMDFQRPFKSFPCIYRVDPRIRASFLLVLSVPRVHGVGPGTDGFPLPF